MTWRVIGRGHRHPHHHHHHQPLSRTNEALTWNHTASQRGGERERGSTRTEMWQKQGWGDVGGCTTGATRDRRRVPPPGPCLIPNNSSISNTNGSKLPTTVRVRVVAARRTLFGPQVYPNFPPTVAITTVSHSRSPGQKKERPKGGRHKNNTLEHAESTQLSKEMGEGAECKPQVLMGLLATCCGCTAGRGTRYCGRYSGTPWLF